MKAGARAANGYDARERRDAWHARTFAAAELGAPDGRPRAEELEQRRRRVHAGRLVPLAVHGQHHRRRRWRRRPHLSPPCETSGTTLLSPLASSPGHVLLQERAERWPGSEGHSLAACCLYRARVRVFQRRTVVMHALTAAPASGRASPGGKRQEKVRSQPARHSRSHPKASRTRLDR